MCEYKILYLYLQAHPIYLFQLLDIGVFGSLKQNYKILLAKKIRFII